MKPLWLCAVLLLAGCGKPAEKAEEAEPEAVATVSVVTAERRDMEETTAAQGTLQSEQGASVKVAPSAPGRLTAVFVKEGDHVRAGQAVATLDARAQEAQTRSAEAGFRASVATANQTRLATRAAESDAQSGVKVAVAALSAATGERDGAIQAAQTALKLAQADLAKTLAGARPQELVQARDALRQAEATRSRARIESERQQFLFEKGVSARRQADDAKTALEVAEAGVESARQSLELVEAGARKEDRDAAQLRVKQAEQALEQARKSGDARILQSRAALKQAEGAWLAVRAKAQEALAARSGAEKAAADVSSARVQTELTTLRSPLAGTVVRRLLGVGDMADPATPLLEIADARKLDLLASLPAEEAFKVRPGQSARLSSGKSAFVVSVGAVDPQTNLAPVRLHLSESDSLRAGTFLTAKIVVRVAKGAIVVPKAALLSRDGKSVVFVASGEIAKETPVTVGIETGDGVEIRSGLSAGAKVVTVGGYELSNGAKIQTEKAEKP